MEDGNVWAVDRIAAAELIAALRQAPDEDGVDIAAVAFARARLQNQRWAANRVHEAAIRLLERRAREELAHREPAWSEGYRFAEEALMANHPADLLGTDARPKLTKGQIVRSLFRTAQQNEIRELRSPIRRARVQSKLLKS